MYAAYTLTYAGYVATYPSPANALILALTIMAFAARAHAEERLLSEDASYRAYRERVRWRFLPGLC
jgi:protein-S-isoprenylcysteine O-methyltransferase Ste14